MSLDEMKLCTRLHGDAFIVIGMKMMSSCACHVVRPPVCDPITSFLYGTARPKPHTFLQYTIVHNNSITQMWLKPH